VGAPPQAPFSVLPSKTRRRVLELVVDDVQRRDDHENIGFPGIVDVEAVPGAHPPNVLSDLDTAFESYDDFNNLTASHTTSFGPEGDWFLSYRGTYENQLGDSLDPTTFILGMPKRQEWTNTIPGGDAKVRVTTYETNVRTGLVNS